MFCFLIWVLIHKWVHFIIYIKLYPYNCTLYNCILFCMYVISQQTVVIKSTFLQKTAESWEFHMQDDDTMSPGWSLRIFGIFCEWNVEYTGKKGGKQGWNCRLGPGQKVRQCVLRPLEFILQALGCYWKFLIKEVTYSGLSFRKLMQAIQWKKTDRRGCSGAGDTS